MYALKLDKNRMAKLYHLREARKKKGKKSTIIGIVRDAVDREMLTDDKEYFRPVELKDCIVLPSLE